MKQNVVIKVLKKNGSVRNLYGIHTVEEGKKEILNNRGDWWEKYAMTMDGYPVVWAEKVEG